MNLAGLSDSLALSTINPTVCERCRGAVRIDRGACLTCLLRTGVEPDEAIEAEAFAAILDEIAVSDRDWRLGHYQILEEIGRGGMGVIYRARQRHSKRIVALKRVLSYHGDSRETLERFRREAEAAASLDHPNILPIYEVGEAEGLPYFTMKYATGGSLQQAAPTLRAEPRECVRLLAKVTRAVAFAHREGILHRDLKPGNILLDAHGEPFVTDFGLAKWIDANSDLTRSLAIFGTPGFIAPEQATGDRAALTPTADVYSLGAILFDLLAGRPPFLGEHALAVIRRAADKSAPRLRSLVQKADRDLETICAKCLEREAPARYRSASDLAEDLERWLEGRPIIARPVLPPARIWRWAKRNPTLASSVATALALGAVCVIAGARSSRLSSIVEEAEIAQHTIAIMPLEDLSELTNGSSAATAFLSALTDTSKVTKGIYLRPLMGMPPDQDPWSPEHWKQIGQASHTRYILSGSIRHRQETQRLVLRMIDTTTGNVIRTWLSDVDSSSGAAKRLVSQVVDVMHGSPIRKLPDSESSFMMVDGDVDAAGGTDNAEARNYYARGKELYQRNNFPDLVRAIDSFRKAIEIDSAYAQPHAILGTAYGLMALQPGGDWLAQAAEETAIALKLAPMLPESRLAHGEILARQGRLHASIDECVTAYELDPAAARIAAKVGDAYHRTGQADLAVRWYEKAKRREVRPECADMLGDAWMDLGDFAKAEAAYKIAAVFRPDLPAAAAGFARLALFRGDYDEARKQSEMARLKYKDNPQPIMTAGLVEFFTGHLDAAEKLYREALAFGRNRGVEFPGCVRFTSALGYIQNRVNEGTALLEESLAVDQDETVSEPENPRSWYSLAADESALGNKEAAVVALNKSIEAGWIDFHSMTLDPRFDSIRATPRFQQAVAQLQQLARQMAERTKQ